MKKVEQVTLKEPLTIGGQTFTTIDVRRPCVGDEEDAMEQAISMGRGENRVTLEICLFSILTSIPYDKLRGMDAEDYTAIRKAADAVSRPTKKEEAKAEEPQEQKSA